MKTHSTLCKILVASVITSSAWAVPMVVTSRAAQNSDDSFDWGAFGPESTLVPAGASAGTALGNTVSVSSGSLGSVYIQSSSWGGNFSPGDTLYFNNGSGPTTLTFGSEVRGVGFNVQADFYGAYGGQLEAFDALNNSLGIFGYSGISSGAGDGSAAYIGILDSSATIKRVVITGLIASQDPNDFAINLLSINSGGAAAPELNPGSALVPIAFMFFTLLALGHRRQPKLVLG